LNPSITSPDAANIPSPRIVALTSPGGFSGLPDAVLGELSRYCRISALIDGLRTPVQVRALTALRTFYPGRREWGRRYYAALGRQIKTPRSLLERIRRCERELVRLDGGYDLIYQFGALFGALERPGTPRLVLHVDFTTRLAEEYYPPWLPPSRTETDEWNVLEGRIYHSADLILVPTELVAASLSEHYKVGTGKIAIVGMGAHIQELVEDFAKPQNRSLVFAGPDFKRHGGAVAVQIFERLRQRFPDAVLTTLTNWSVDAPGVQNLGIVSRARLHEVLRWAAVLLMPGPVGGYQTVTEAMAAKCLCVVNTNNPHMYSLLKNGEDTGLLPSAGPTEAVARIAEYFRVPERLTAVGERARTHVLQECSWQRVVGRAWKEIQERLA
jgi:glycosyltransferase involved in cell wall biosynthesis